MITDQNGNHSALPIISVYILGYQLEEVKSPVVKVNRQVRDLITGSILECNEAFIESLTHDCYIVQVGRLRAPYRNDLERLLSIFDQTSATSDKHVLEVDEERYPDAYRRLLRRLNRAVTEEQVRRTMDAEDDFLEELEAKERRIQDMAEVIQEQGKALQEKDQIVQAQSRALEEKEKALEESLRLIQELKERLREP